MFAVIGFVFDNDVSLMPVHTKKVEKCSRTSKIRI